MVFTLGFNVLFSVKPLTCKLSAVFRNIGSIFWPTFTSPWKKGITIRTRQEVMIVKLNLLSDFYQLTLYIKSNNDFISENLTSLRNIIGCGCEFCRNIVSKYGEQAESIV